MSNPFNTPNYNQYKEAYKMFSQSKNPMQLFMNMASQDPNMQHIMSMIQAGQNPQMIFNQLCQQRGINPQEFLKNITS